jgi:ssRNA-specific RNase YbeY (16S rRNA maturation enzyme)
MHRSITNHIFLALLYLISQYCASAVQTHSVAKRNGAIEGDDLTTDLTSFPEFPDTEEKQIVNWKHPWPGGNIYYEISPEFNEADIDLIHGAMKEIEKKTCITFHERTDEKDYVLMLKVLGDGCYSATGRHGGMQKLNLDPRKCIQHGKIVHELLHVVGFHHEHQRPDRNKYVEILWDNIKDDCKDQFDILSAPVSYLKGFPYDSDSVLHYGPISFFLAKDEDKPVLRPKKHDPNMGQRVGMTALDATKVNLLYNCP